VLPRSDGELLRAGGATDGLERDSLDLAVGRHAEVVLGPVGGRDRLPGGVQPCDAEQHAIVHQDGGVRVLVADDDDGQAFLQQHHGLGVLGHARLDRRIVDRELRPRAGRPKDHEHRARGTQRAEVAVIQMAPRADVHVQQAPRHRHRAHGHVKLGAALQQKRGLVFVALGIVGREQEDDPALLPRRVNDRDVGGRKALLALLGVRLLTGLDRHRLERGVERREHAPEPCRQMRHAPQRIEELAGLAGLQDRAPVVRVLRRKRVQPGVRSAAGERVVRRRTS
jgi:hypothetical protein